MFRLALLLFVVIGATLAGIGIVVVLVSGLDTMRPVVIAAAVGFALAVPVSWMVARRLMSGA